MFTAKEAYELAHANDKEVLLRELNDILSSIKERAMQGYYTGEYAISVNNLTALRKAGYCVVLFKENKEFDIYRVSWERQVIYPRTND